MDAASVWWVAHDVEEPGVRTRRPRHALRLMGIANDCVSPAFCVSLPVFRIASDCRTLVTKDGCLVDQQ